MVISRRVSDRTRIVSAPPAVVVASSTDDVTLACDATTDARRSSHLLVTWYRDELSVSEEGRVRVTDKGSRLVIEISAVSDSGIYRCTASNGIDEDSAIAILTVKGQRRTRGREGGQSNICPHRRQTVMIDNACMSSSSSIFGWLFVFLLCISFTVINFHVKLVH